MNHSRGSALLQSAPLPVDDLQADAPAFRHLQSDAPAFRHLQSDTAATLPAAELRSGATIDPRSGAPAPTRRRRPGLFNAYMFILLPYIVPMLVIAGYRHGGIFTFMPLVVVFGLIPIVDAIVGVDPHNPSEERMKALAEMQIFRWLTWAYVPAQVALVTWGAWVVTHDHLTTLETVGFVWSLGMVTGAIGITFAHELCHKANRLEQSLGKVLLLTVSYMHFHIEHNLGHHVNVSTPSDPASSRLGESFYRFYPRTVIGSFVSAWRLEVRRLQRANQATWSVHNQMLWFVALPILFAAALGGVFGWQAVPYFFAQSVVAFSLLEAVNYIEHYGLERREVAPGRYEKVNPQHSWNSNNRVTNGFLIMLQRHSDHHANAQRRYQLLRHFDESPQLPTGYAGMLVLALFPPLWRRVMDPRVLAHRQRLEAQRTSTGTATATGIGIGTATATAT